MHNKCTLYDVIFEKKKYFCMLQHNTTTNEDVYPTWPLKYHANLLFTSISKERKIRRKQYLGDLLYAKQGERQSKNSDSLNLPYSPLKPNSEVHLLKFTQLSWQIEMGFKPMSRWFQSLSSFNFIAGTVKIFYGIILWGFKISQVLVKWVLLWWRKTWWIFCYSGYYITLRSLCVPI